MTTDDALAPIREKFAEWADNEVKRDEEFWRSLSSDDQLRAFCYVVRKIHQGEIEQENSYRSMLYDVFGFGPESYVVAQFAGYLEIHNLLQKAQGE